MSDRDDSRVGDDAFPFTKRARIHDNDSRVGPTSLYPFDQLPKQLWVALLLLPLPLMRSATYPHVTCFPVVTLALIAGTLKALAENQTTVLQRFFQLAVGEARYGFACTPLVLVGSSGTSWWHTWIWVRMTAVQLTRRGLVLFTILHIKIWTIALVHSKGMFNLWHLGADYSSPPPYTVVYVYLSFE